jgi:hypothetical protein
MGMWDGKRGIIYNDNEIFFFEKEDAGKTGNMWKKGT